MARNRKGEAQYYFTRGQLLLLVVGFTLTSIVVFFLGVLIGQGIEERKLVRKEEPLVKIPIQPLSQGSPSAPGTSAKEEMTFYDTLAKAPSSLKETTDEKRSLVLEVKKAPSSQKGRRPEEEKVVASTGEGVWTVQVNAYPNERDAKNLTKKLKDKGYDAYVASTNIKGRTWYRVRVGRLESQEAAKELQEILRTKENFTKSMTTNR